MKVGIIVSDEYQDNAMTHSRFFQLSLFFPVVLWLLGLLIFSIVNKEGHNFILKHMFDAFRVFVPYLIFAAAIWKLVSNRPYRQLVLFAFAVPIVWGVFFTLCYIVHSYIMDPMVDKNVLWMMSFWATFVAYLVEIIPFLVLMIFKGDFASAMGQGTVDAALDKRPSMPEG